MPGVSLNPNTFVEGGLIDDVDVEFAEVQFCAYDYNGSVAQPVLALGIKMRHADPDDPAKVKDTDQYYSAGDLANFLPSEDGYELIPQGGKTSLNANSNCAKFLESLQKAAQGNLDQVLNSGSVKGLVGLKVHVARTAQPKRSGIVRTGKNANREQTILLVTKINAYPGQAYTPAATASVAAPRMGQGQAQVAKPGPVPVPTATVAPNPTPAPTPTPAITASAGGDVDTLATEVLYEMLSQNNGALPKKDIPIKAFRAQALSGNPLKGAVVKRIFEDAFLSSAPGIMFDGATVKIA